MQEMWKIFDPYCKCSAYFTDQEAEFDRERLQYAQDTIKSAVQVKAVVDGQEMKLWKMPFVNNKIDLGGFQYWNDDEIKAIGNLVAQYLEAHKNKTRVNVIAVEEPSPAQLQEMEEEIEKNPTEVSDDKMEHLREKIMAKVKGSKKQATEEPAEPTLGKNVTISTERYKMLDKMESAAQNMAEKVVQLFKGKITEARKDLIVQAAEVMRINPPLHAARFARSSGDLGSMWRAPTPVVLSEGKE